MNYDDLYKKLDFLKDYGNGILLNENEFNVLERYGINPTMYNNLKSLMFDVEKILEDEDIEELEQILIDISDRNYYMNTNK